MGFEVVYCFKCQKRLSEGDFQKGDAFRVGITTTCRKCSPELIASLPAEQQAALLAGPASDGDSPSAAQPERPRDRESDRFRHAEPLPLRHVQAVRAKRNTKPTASSVPPSWVVALGAVVVVVLSIFLLWGRGKPRTDGGDPAVASSRSAVSIPHSVKAPPRDGAPETPFPGGRSSVPDGNPRRAQEAEESLRAARAYRESNPADIEGIAKRFEVAMWDAERTPLFDGAKQEYEAAARQAAAHAPRNPAPSSAPAPPESVPPDGGPVSAQPLSRVVASAATPPPGPAVLTETDLAAKEEALRREHETAVGRALADFKAAMAAARDDGARAAAVEALGRAETDPRIASALVPYLEGDPLVRQKAIQALGAYSGMDSVIRPLVKAVLADRRLLKDSLWSLFLSAQPVAASAVAPLLKDEDFGVVESAAWVLDSLYDPVSVESMIALWERLKAAEAREKLGRLREVLPGSLVRLTGQSFLTPEAYRVWWSRSRLSYAPLSVPKPIPLCQAHHVIDCPAGTRLPPGTLACEVWTGVRDVRGDLAKGAWLLSPPVRTCVVRKFESPSDIANHYAARLRGYLVPPADGEYRFWIAADDQGELYLSPDERPEAKARVGRIDIWTAPRCWDMMPEQASRPVLLKAGRRYYVEAHAVELTGGDLVSVAWQPPGGRREVIPGRFLIPFDCVDPLAATPAPAGGATAVGGAAQVLAGGGVSPAVDAPAPGPPARPARGLIGWWRFDESGGETAEDSSGCGHGARLVGPVQRTLGRFGRGIRFAGDGGYVELPSVPDLDRVQAGSCTLAAWFRSEATPEAGVPSTERYAVLVKAGKHTGIAYNHEQRFVAELWPASGPPLVAGAWDRACPPWSFHHVAVVVDREAGEMRVYLDGARAGARPLPAGAGAADYGKTPWRIGIADPAGGARRWAARGVIDEVRIYDRALAGGEVEALFAGPPPGPAAEAVPKAVPASVPAAVPQPVPAPAPAAGRKPALEVARLVLIDAETSRDLLVLRDGMVFKLSALPTRNLTVRADTLPPVVGSVVLELDGNDRRVESVAPYSLFGDVEGKLKAGRFQTGEHVIRATPYAEKDGAGETGAALSVRFTVVE